jgi:hypothetical protein
MSADCYSASPAKHCLLWLVYSIVIGTSAMLVVPLERKGRASRRQTVTELVTAGV